MLCHILDFMGDILLNLGSRVVFPTVIVLFGVSKQVKDWVSDRSYFWDFLRSIQSYDGLLSNIFTFSYIFITGVEYILLSILFFNSIIICYLLSISYSNLIIFYYAHQIIVINDEFGTIFHANFNSILIICITSIICLKGVIL